jgi:hypothetical protein
MLRHFQEVAMALGLSKYDGCELRQLDGKHPILMQKFTSLRHPAISRMSLKVMDGWMAMGIRMTCDNHLSKLQYFANLN